MTGGIDKIPFRIFSVGCFLNESCVVTVRDKTDVLTVMLVGIQQAVFLGNLPSFCFFQCTEREQGMGKLFLCQGIQDIALILPWICRFLQQKSSIFFLDICIMSGCDIVTAKLQSPVVKLPELQVAVAVDAWVWSFTVLIRIDEAVNDLCLKISLEIKYIIWKSQYMGYIPGIFHIA